MAYPDEDITNLVRVGSNEVVKEKISYSFDEFVTALGMGLAKGMSEAEAGKRSFPESSIL